MNKLTPICCAFIYFFKNIFILSQNIESPMIVEQKLGHILTERDINNAMRINKIFPSIINKKKITNDDELRFFMISILKKGLKNKAIFENVYKNQSNKIEEIKSSINMNIEKIKTEKNFKKKIEENNINQKTFDQIFTLIYFSQIG